MKIEKIIVNIVLIICLILSINLTCYGSSINTSEVEISKQPISQFDDLGNTIISTIRVIGMIVSVAALMIMGIRYMLSSAEEKAMEKKSMIFYCIGAFLLFAIVNIVSMIYDWVSA